MCSYERINYHHDMSFSHTEFNSRRFQSLNQVFSCDTIVGPNDKLIVPCV